MKGGGGRFRREERGWKRWWMRREWVPSAPSTSFLWGTLIFCVFSFLYIFLYFVFCLLLSELNLSFLSCSSFSTSLLDTRRGKMIPKKEKKKQKPEDFWGVHIRWFSVTIKDIMISQVHKSVLLSFLLI